ncbi:protein longifolia 2 [Tanacetum coccineum]
MCKISKFFKSLFGFKPSDPKRRGWTLFKSSHKQHNHDEAISADQGSVQSRPPSVVAKLMGLDPLPDSATTNQKQEMGMTPISPPFYAVTSKGHASMRTVPFTQAKSCHSGYSDHPNYMSHTESSHAKVRSLSASGVRRRSKYSNIKQNDDQHREAVGEPMKASYKGTQVSREVAMVPNFSEEIDYRQRPSSIQEVGSCAFSSRGGNFHPLTYDSIQVIKDQWEMPDDVIPNTLSFGVSSEINRKKLQNIEHLVQKPTRLNSTHDEAHTDYIASLNENTKPDDSNLPKPEPSNKKLHNKEKFHMKLIFDIVNEVLAKKLALVVPSLETFSSKDIKRANWVEVPKDQIHLSFESLREKSDN